MLLKNRLAEHNNFEQVHEFYLVTLVPCSYNYYSRTFKSHNTLLKGANIDNTIIRNFKF